MDTHNVYRIDRPREYRQAGADDLIQLLPVAGTHPLFIERMRLEQIVFAMVSGEYMAEGSVPEERRGHRSDDGRNHGPPTAVCAGCSSNCTPPIANRPRLHVPKGLKHMQMREIYKGTSTNWAAACTRVGWRCSVGMGGG